MSVAPKLAAATWLVGLSFACTGDPFVTVPASTAHGGTTASGGASAGGTNASGAGGTGACEKATLVVAEASAQVEPALAPACRYENLGAAIQDVQAGTTKRIVVVGTQAAITSTVEVPDGVSLEGASGTVALTASGLADGNPLVTLGAGSSLRGFALDGAGKLAGVATTNGTATLSGPLTVTNTTFGLDVADGTTATVTGTAQATIRFDQNQKGVVVRGQAGLTMTGAKGTEALVVSGTTAGPGVLVEALVGDSKAITITGVQFENNSSDQGALEIRQGRNVTVKQGTWATNDVHVRLNGESTSKSGSFTSLVLDDNDFGPAQQGASVCGFQLGAATQLPLGQLNRFADAGGAKQTCNDLKGSAQNRNCAGGLIVDRVGSLPPNEDQKRFSPIQCCDYVSGTCQ